MTKKLLILFMSFLIILSGITPALAKTDTAVYTEYCAFLEYLSVINSDTLSGDYISRISFLKSAIHLMGRDYPILNTDTEVKFGDVSQNDIAYLKNAVALSLVSDAESFRPNDAITIGEVSKILVSLMGYGDLAELKGGYPYGYYSMARETDIFDVDYDLNKVLDKDTFIKIMLNVLAAIPARVVSVDNDSIKVAVNDGKAWMTIYFDIYKDTGIIDANPYTTLLSADAMHEGEVRIDGTIFKCKDESLYDMLGLRVDYYYEYTSGKIPELIYALENEDMKKYDISYKDFANDGIQNQFTYYEGNKTKTLKIKPLASYIYNDFISNGSVISKYPCVGNTVLIDNDNDSVIDVVKIYDYSTMVAASKSDYDKKLIGCDNSIINLGEDEDISVIYKNGARASYEDIVSDDVISYYETALNGKYFRRLLVTDKHITGFVTAVGDSELKINGETYTFDTSIRSSLDLRSEQKLYIDVFGRVVRAEYYAFSEKSYVYGYLQAISLKTFDEVQLKIFTENNRWVILSLAKRVVYNSGSVTAKQLYDILNSLSPMSQLIRYKVNADGEISELKTAVQTVRWSSEEKTEIDLNTFRLSYEGSNVQYRAGTKSIDDKLYHGNNTTVFYIPNNESDDNSYAVLDEIGSVYGNDAYISNIRGYDMSLMGVPEAVVIHEAGFTKSYEDLFVIDEISMGLNSEDDEVYYIYGYFKGEKICLYTVDTACINPATYEMGNVLMPVFNLNGEIIGFNEYFKLASSPLQQQDGNLYDRTGKASGLVHEVDFNVKKLALDVGTAINLYTLNPKNVYIVDTEYELVSKGSIYDIAVGDHVFTRINYLNMIEIVIFK